MAGTSTTKQAAAEDPEAPASPFDEITVETRAGTFHFREVDGETYDQCVEAATTKHEDGRETTNMVTLLRVLADKSSIDKGVGIEQIQKLPMKIRGEVLSKVNGLYFPDELEDFARQLRFAGWTVTPPSKEGDSGNA